MSIASEITRIQGAKADLKTAINAKTDAQHQITTETIDDYAGFVDSISGGSQKPEQSKTTNPSTSQVVVTPDTGYTLSSVTVNAMPSGALSTPTINSSTGVVTASVGTSGYLANGTSSTLQLSTQSSQTITPTTTDQTISGGKYLTGTQTISGDANLVAGNIKKDVTIFGVTGTHEGGGSGTLITKSITQNGTYNASDDNADGYSQVTVNVSGGGTVEPEEKDVNFYDYDGTRLYSYTNQEALLLESMPNLPTRQGITYTEWNIALNKLLFFAQRGDKIDIGAIGKPSDCDIKLIINLEEEYKTPYVFVGANNTCSIDWGDGSTAQTVNPSTYDTSGWINPSHSYSKGGKYEIKITINGNNKNLYLRRTSSINAYNDNQYTGGLLWGGSSSDNNKSNMVYAGCVEEIWLGPKVLINTTHCFSGYTNLKYVLINTPISQEYLFFNCRKLQNFNMTASTSYIKSKTFANCHSLKRITGCMWNFAYNDGGSYAPSGKSEYVFENCFSLKKMPITNATNPSEDSRLDLRSSAYLFKNCFLINNVYVTPCYTINANCFSDDYPHIKVFDFTTLTYVPTLSNINAFSGGASDYEIWVPSSLYSSWVSASNWSSISSHIVAK